MAYLTIGERVEIGATVLDEHASDWYRFVDLELLDIRLIENCVLGQIFGSFQNGTRDLGIEGDRCEEERLGFELRHSEYCSENVGGIAAQYEDEWRTQIMLRLEGDKA